MLPPTIETMLRAANEETVPLLAALPLSRNSHQGHSLSTTLLYPAPALLSHTPPSVYTLCCTKKAEDSTVVTNNPLAFTDPSGKCFFCDLFGFIAAPFTFGQSLWITAIDVAVDTGVLLGDTLSHGGGSKSGSKGGTSTPPPVPPVSSYPGGGTAGLPPGSFPGGENLGLPSGMSIPGPLSWQALLGLWDWDCSTGVCVPGFGGNDFAPGQKQGHTYTAYAACLIGSMPKVIGTSAFGIGLAAAAGRTYANPIPPPGGILRKAPPRTLELGAKWGFKGQIVGAVTFLATYEVELNSAAKSCSNSTGYTPWVFEP